MHARLVVAISERQLPGIPLGSGEGMRNALPRTMGVKIRPDVARMQISVDRKIKSRCQRVRIPPATIRVAYGAIAAVRVANGAIADSEADMNVLLVVRSVTSPSTRQQDAVRDSGTCMCSYRYFGDPWSGTIRIGVANDQQARQEPD